MSYGHAYLEGVMDLDGTLGKMLEAKAFCEERELSYPVEVMEYFSGLDIDIEGPESYIRGELQRVLLASAGGESSRGGAGMHVDLGSGNMDRWVEFDISEIPEGVKRLRLTIDFD